MEVGDYIRTSEPPKSTPVYEGVMYIGEVHNSPTESEDQKVPVYEGSKNMGLAYKKPVDTIMSLAD